MKNIYFVSALLLLSVQAYGQILLDSSYIKVSTITQEIYAPWEIIWGPDNFIWMTHKNSSVSRVNPTTGEVNRILEIPDETSGGSHQIGLAIHPDFAVNHYIYIDYNYDGPNYNPPLNHHIYMKVVRYTFNQSMKRLEDPTIIIDGIKIFDGYHDGGKMIISNNHIFISIGDAKQVENPELHPYIEEGDPFLPQNLDVFNGKILRLKLDGSVPEDNPFAKSPYEKIPRNLIWSYGHRNLQGLVIGKDNTLYYSDHGRDNDDEFGIIEKGFNYGWPLIEGFCDKDFETEPCDTILNHKAPLISWNPNVAPSNMEYVAHSAIPEFKNSIFVGTLTGDNYGKHIAVFNLNEAGDEVVKERSLLDNQYGRIRDFCISPEGEIYFTTSNRSTKSPNPGDDKIMKISLDSAKTPIGIESSVETEILLFPNPSGIERKINVKFPFDRGTVTLYQSNGNIIKTIPVTTKEMILEARYLSAGIYFLHYNYGDKSFRKKIIVE